MARAAMTPSAAHALADAEPTPFWLTDPDRPAARPALVGDETCDLLVVGGGYSGLWTALIAKERDPQRDVVLIEGAEIGWAASGRNGGFCASSSPTASETAWPAGRTNWPPSKSSASATSTPSRRPSPATTSTAPSSAPVRSTSPPSPTRSPSSRSSPRTPPGSASTGTPSSTRTNCAPRSTRRPSAPVCGTATASPCSTRPASPGA